MYICIGTHRINVDQIQTYSFKEKAGVIIIFFTNETLIRFEGKDYDLDILILELDRVCNPKVLKGKLDEIKQEVTKQCSTCKWETLDCDDEPCVGCYDDASMWEAKDE